MAVIELDRMTKDYGYGRGVFDVSFEVAEGEAFGFLGPNGAGKTTTIRHLMGFSRPQKGSARIFGRDSFRHCHESMRRVGYIPGEIALPAGLTGWEFIRMNMGMKGLRAEWPLRRLLDMFMLDPGEDVKAMSLGERRKLAIVTAFVGDPDVLILDEPTSGLDPLMQSAFVDLVKERKREGKTVMLSSHMFDEIDTTCDRIAIIKEGRVVTLFEADMLRHAERKRYGLGFGSRASFDAFMVMGGASGRLAVESADSEGLSAVVECLDRDVSELVSLLAGLWVTRLSHMKVTLEDHFMAYYAGGADYGGAI
ncbi:MAG: ABC transporter ATP-binding protein [Oscillospiraceae bacterium]|nr:ABC transporter ATP-binding protein [Oscillospiraceae bacterium]